MTWSPPNFRSALHSSICRLRKDNCVWGFCREPRCRVGILLAHGARGDCLLVGHDIVHRQSPNEVQCHAYGRTARPKCKLTSQYTFERSIMIALCPDPQERPGGVFLMPLTNFFIEKASTESALTRSHQRQASQSGLSIITSRVRMNCWRRCWSFSMNWAWRGFASMRIATRVIPMKSWRSCSPNLPNGLRSPDGRGPALPAW